ncbi:MAG: hypothetical protein K0Q59_2601, partial [Paenibacillus sp.]|nr:hypothetical protein [Paenibacillus sp.]
KLSLINSAAPLLDDIRGLPDFERYESMVSPLFAMIESGESWDERKDIRAGWKIAPAKVLE